MIIFCILLLVFENRANEYPPVMYEIVPYSYSTFFKTTTLTPRSKESSEEESGSDEYVTCTCDICSDISCEEYCKTCPKNDQKQGTNNNIEYKGNYLPDYYRRVALITGETTETTYRAIHFAPNTIPNRDENKGSTQDRRNIKTYNQNEIQTDFDNSLVKLTFNRAQDDVINIEFLLNDRDKTLNEDKYVDTPIRRTKFDNELANTHFRNIKILQS